MRDLADAGRVIAGRYRLESPVGRGAMGIVWRARDQLLDREVAVKEVQIADTLTAEERANAYQRTLREAKTAARLSHPGVVSVYDVASEEGRPWIVMELVNAHSLDQVLASDGPLSPRQTAEVGRQLLSALSVAHGAGVLHRDVKPSNVLLGTDGRAVLTDFGIATFQGDPKLTQTGMVMGSPGFTAPERIRGGGATPASDLWSLGATLYAAVQGHGPYESRGGAITTMSAIINEDAPGAPAAGPLAGVIESLLRREPADRPDAVTASRMISDVLPLLADRPARAGGYAPTALSESPLGGRGGPGGYGAPGGSRVAEAAGVPGESSVSSVSSGAGGAGMGSWPAETSLDSQRPLPEPAAGPQWANSPPTTPQPSFGDLGTDAGASSSRVGGAGGAGGAGVAGRAGGSATSRFAEQPEPDFSSWYDPSPRSGPAERAPSAGYGPSGYGSPGYGPSAPAPSGYPPAEYGPSEYGPSGYGSSAPPGSPGWGKPPSGPRRSGVRWKLALAALAVIGAGAGAATVMALRHHTTNSPGPGQSSGTSTGTGAGTGTATLPSSGLQLVNAIDMPRPATGPLPADFTSYSQSPSVTGTTAGFQIAYPAAWSVSRRSTHQWRLQSPDNGATYVLVDLTPHTYPADMLREAKYIRDQSIAEGRFPGYAEQQLSRLVIRGRPGAVWKFTWNNNGIKQEVLDLLYIANTSAGAQSYALYFTSPLTDWTGMHPVFNEEAETFATQPS
jgi:serine/threonine protein kinase